MVGDILRKKREELGLDLKDISKTLRISYTYLKAIEDEAFEKLPEEVYVKGYIREYAEMLKIDPETPIKAYIQKISPPNPEPKGVSEKKTEREKKSNVRYFLIPLILAVLLITAAYILFTDSSDKKELPQTASEAEKETVASDVETGEIPAPVAEPVNELPPAPSGPAKDTVSKPSKSQHVLEVIADDETWLLVTIDETTSKEMMMQPDESIKFNAEKGFSLTIGNARGVTLIFDGKEIDTLGKKGQVVKLKLP
ncbi:MAG: hypothetical protein A2Y97_14190 [Nitrospirae bacterium RBG_13_39_12]|nr:MAG: hypothetical protein A2Y97_14190 [Nitrospirae bacterium RBG_13_39_12]